MLCLSRKVDERIRLRITNADGSHTDIWLTVIDLSVRQRRVRLGLQAPQSVVIHREEVIKKRQEQAQEQAT